MSDVTFTDVMQAYAEEALDYAKRRYGVTFDYSEKSLEEVDRILADQIKAGLLTPEDLSETEQEDVWGFCKTMGGYVGEVIIRNIGGIWQTKDIGGGAASVKLVTTGGIVGSPPEAVWRALTEPYKSIVTYYRTLRFILRSGDESNKHRIQVMTASPLSSKPPGQASDVEERPWWKFW